MKNLLTALALVLTPAVFAGQATFNEMLEDCNSRVQSKQKREESIAITCQQTRDQWREEAGTLSQQTKRAKVRYNVALSIDSLKDGRGSQASEEIFSGKVEDFSVTWQCPTYRRYDVTYKTTVKFASCQELQAAAAKLGINTKEPAKHSFVTFCEAYTTDTLVQGIANADPVTGALPAGLVAKKGCEVVEFCAGSLEAPRSASVCDQQ